MQLEFEFGFWFMKTPLLLVINRNCKLGMKEYIAYNLGVCKLYT
jgi:hypothetical protein